MAHINHKKLKKIISQVDKDLKGITVSKKDEAIGGALFELTKVFSNI